MKRGWFATALGSAPLVLVLGAGACVDRASSGDHDASTSDGGDDSESDRGEPASPWPNCELADELAAQRFCAAATDENACVLLNDAPEQCHQCVWADWVPTTIAPDGTCSFGAVSATCAAEIIHPNDAGCYGDDVMFETDAGATRLLLAPYCYPVGDQCGRTNTEDGGTIYEPAECACAYDPAYPG